MKIYDTFMFHDEVDLLHLRMQEHDPFVDHFVIVQADLTHTGKPKEILSIKTNPAFSKFQKKIIEVTALLDKNPQSPWDNEQKQRNAGVKSINFESDDLVYISDADEIISRQYWPYLIQRLKSENLIAVWQNFFYYNLNLQAKNIVWTMPKICRASVTQVSGLTASQIRLLSTAICVPFSCGWHFSYLMPPERISKKISAFAHQEYNVAEINQIEAISKSIQRRRDLFGRDINFHVVPVTQTWPIGVLEDPKWKGYILPVSARERVNETVSRIKRDISNNSFRTKLVSQLNQIRFRSVQPTEKNTIDKKTFNELLLCKPPFIHSSEWRRVIEFLSSVLPELEGSFSAKQCAELFMQVIKSVPKNGKIVELGSGRGRTSVFASRAAAVKDSSLFCVDQWAAGQTSDVFGAFQRNVSLYGCNNLVVYSGEREQIAANWNHGLIDFLIIDARQDYDLVIRELKLWFPHLKPGAVVCGDDWNREDRPDLKGSVRKAFTDFFKTQIPNLGITERFWAHQI